MEMNIIATKDNEWTHEELYWLAYDECTRALTGLKYLLDKEDLKHPEFLLHTIINELGDNRNLVDRYNEIYDNKSQSETSDDVFAKYDDWMLETIQATLKAHKYKGYI